MKFLRSSKPTKNVPGSIIVDRPPGGGPNAGAPPSAASTGLGLGLGLDRGDLSSKIEPYTFGSNASTPQAPSTQFSSQVHSSLPPPQPHQHQQQPPPQQPPSQAQQLSRRLSGRGRDSSEDPWVLVGEPVDSRSSSIASLGPAQGMQNIQGVQNMQNVQNMQGQPTQGMQGMRDAGMQGMPGGAAAPYNSPQFTQNSTVVSNANSNVLPINVLPSSPASPPPAPVQTQPIQREMNRTPQGTKRPNASSNPSHQGHQQVNSVYSVDPRESVEREGSIHSQQQADKGWRNALFGNPRDREANADLFRMIGFLTAAAPDDWSLVLEVCERASKSESASKEAAKALRSEFRYGQPSAQLSAARLWAIMLQNTSDTFISQTASRKFLDSLEAVINSNNTSPVVRERLLDVLASAAYTFGRKPGKEGFAVTWRRVRPTWKPEEGVPFDPEDSLFESAFPRRPAPMQPPISSQPYPPQSGGGEPRERRERGERDREGGKDRSKRDREDKYHQQQRQLEAGRDPAYRVTNPPNLPSRKDRGIIPPDEDIRRLFQECDVAKNNAQVLNNALIYAQPSSLGADSLIQEFHNKCRASQELIAAQIPWAFAGAERSRKAADAKKASKESGSDNTPGKLSKKPPKDVSANTPNAKDATQDLTKEEKLLAALLSANQELVEVFQVYDEMEKLAFAEMEEKEIAQRSVTETKLDRTTINLITPDGSLMTKPPQTQGASSSSRSPSPSIGQTQTGSNASKTTSATSLPSLTTVPSHPSVNPGGRTPNSRDLPSLPYQSGDLLVPTGPASAMYQQTHSLPASPLQPMPHSPIPAPGSQNQQGHPNPPGQPYHHTQHSSNHSVDRAIYGANNLALPHVVPHGPRQQPSPNAHTRSRTPSPDRHGLGTGTPPTAGNHQDYAPPSHPPPTFNQNQNQNQHQPQTQAPAPAQAPAANPRAGGGRVDSLRSRAGSPTGAPPGLAPGQHPSGQGYASHPTHPGHTASVGSTAGMQNVAGMRIDMDAANQYADLNSDDELKTPIKPSEKALGKRRAAVQQAPDEEELERREEAELEEAFFRSTAPPDADAETPTAAVKYVYDAAAERARQLDQEEKMRRQQLRTSLIRPSTGDSNASAPQSANTASANGKVGK